MFRSLGKVESLPCMLQYPPIVASMKNSDRSYRTYSLTYAYYNDKFYTTSPTYVHGASKITRVRHGSDDLREGKKISLGISYHDNVFYHQTYLLIRTRGRDIKPIEIHRHGHPHP